MDFKDIFLKLIENDKICEHIDINAKTEILAEFQKYNVSKIISKDPKFQHIIPALILYNMTSTNKKLKHIKIAHTKKNLFSIQNISSIVGVSSKTFSRLNKELFSNEPCKNKYINFTNESNDITKALKKYKRSTKPAQLTKKRLITIFKYNYEYMKLLYPDKTAIKIKEYLANIYLSLLFAGYTLTYNKLEELFGEYYIYLNIVLSDGRNNSDFVKIKDIYKNSYFKVYMEF